MEVGWASRAVVGAACMVPLAEASLGSPVEGACVEGACVEDGAVAWLAG